MDDKPITTIGRCYACRRAFAFDPSTVTLFDVDPATGLPPGMTPLGSMREPTPESLARAVKEPVCPRCVEKARAFLDAPAAPWPPWPRPDR
ncbi:hypothetical protein [Microbispora sp. NPDC049125]|uniref:hypothetical protein n=1 Tax=Microbispora sp. NPDC049125 TaxID=3154929 RepID=UPI0034665CFF